MLSSKNCASPIVESADVTKEELYIPLASMDERADVATLAASATTAAASEEVAVDHGEYVSMVGLLCVWCCVNLCFCKKRLPQQAQLKKQSETTTTNLLLAAYRNNNAFFVDGVGVEKIAQQSVVVG